MAQQKYKNANDLSQAITDLTEPLTNLDGINFKWDDGEFGPKENAFKNWGRIYKNKLESDLRTKARSKKDALNKFYKKYPLMENWSEAYDSIQLDDRGYGQYVEPNEFSLSLEDLGDNDYYISFMRYWR